MIYGICVEGKRKKKMCDIKFPLDISFSIPTNTPTHSSYYRRTTSMQDDEAWNFRFFFIHCGRNSSCSHVEWSEINLKLNDSIYYRAKREWKKIANKLRDKSIMKERETVNSHLLTVWFLSKLTVSLTRCFSTRLEPSAGAKWQMKNLIKFKSFLWKFLHWNFFARRFLIEFESNFHQDHDVDKKNSISSSKANKYWIKKQTVAAAATSDNGNEWQ